MRSKPIKVFLDYDYFHRKTTTPEERLVIAIFDRALRDWLCPEKFTHRKFLRSAKMYFRNRNPNQFGSFGHFCLLFELNPNEVLEYVETDEFQERLREMRKVSGNA